MQFELENQNKKGLLMGEDFGKNDTLHQIKMTQKTPLTGVTVKAAGIKRERNNTFARDTYPWLGTFRVTSVKVWVCDKAFFTELALQMRVRVISNSEVTKSHPKGDDDIRFSIDWFHK